MGWNWTDEERKQVHEEREQLVQARIADLLARRAQDGQVFTPEELVDAVGLDNFTLAEASGGSRPCAPETR